MPAVLAILLAQLSQPAEVSPALKAARVYFEEFEYARCVQRAEQASREQLSERALAQAELLTGLCKFHLGKESEAATHFRVALRLDPSISLPKYTSPRIVALFDAEAARRPRVAEPPRAETASPPPPVAKPRADVPTATTAQTPTPAVDETAISRTAPVAPSAPAYLPDATTGKLAARPSLVWPIALGGVAVVTAGSGALFGMEAKRLEGLANAAPFESDFRANGQLAERNALIANACFGAATLVATGALVSFLLTPR